MTYIYARKHFFLKSILSGTLRARHRENRPQVVKQVGILTIGLITATTTVLSLLLYDSLQ